MKIKNTNQIQLFLHCSLCLEEQPEDQSPKEFQKIEVGWTKQGIQVWCTRHNCNIMHMDFEGSQHYANISRRKRNVRHH